MNISMFQRYNYFLLYRSLKPWIVAGVLAVLAYVTLLYFQEQQSLYAKLAASIAIQDQLALALHTSETFGAPGYVATDWTEGTTNLELRRFK